MNMAVITTLVYRTANSGFGKDPGAGPGRIPEHCGVGFMMTSCPSLEYVLLGDSKGIKK